MHSETLHIPILGNFGGATETATLFHVFVRLLFIYLFYLSIFGAKI